MPRKRRGSDTVHYCQNCSNWPKSDYVETTNGEKCNECMAKQRDKNCRAG